MLILFVSFLFVYLDTAAVYRNEEDIGQALQSLLSKHNLAREDIFITTKLCKQLVSFRNFSKIPYIVQFFTLETNLNLFFNTKGGAMASLLL